MQKKLEIAIVFLVFMMSLLSYSINGSIATSTDTTIITKGNSASKSDSNIIYSPFAFNIPVIDGFIAPNEWKFNAVMDFTQGKAYIMNDNIRLYILFDVLNDTGNDAPGPVSDSILVSFDVNGNHIIDNMTDINYGIIPGTTSIRYQYYYAPAEWSPLLPDTYSSVGESFSCNTADGSLIVRDPPFANTCNPHRIWEVAIDLGEIQAKLGGNVWMGFQVSSATPNFVSEYPANFDVDFSNYADIKLAYVSAWPISNSNVALNYYRPNGDQGIEVTQAVQNRQNVIPLVDGKTTEVRVYPEAMLSSSTAVSLVSQPVIVYLYGTTYGAVGTGISSDLPGSPLAMQFTTAVPIDRTKLSSSANFLLPDSWTHGVDIYYAVIRDTMGHKAIHPNVGINYQIKSGDFTVWIVKVNTGTVNNPVLASDAEIARQESAMKVVYPLKDVTFIVKPWTVLGACTGCTVGGQVNNLLNGYLIFTILDWAINGQKFKLPDVIYGFMTGGGGISDPVWLGGKGYVANGFIGTSQELTMAHEINHDLDRSQSGTWGHHVSNPNNNNDPSWGCGAVGPDLNWVHPPNDDHITRTISGYDTGVLGYDTRNPQVVVPGSWPDFMSYCTSGSTPTKWISGYRWNNLLGTLPNLYFSSQRKASQTIAEIMDVSGHVNANNTGSFDGIYALMGSSDYLTQNPPVGVPTNASLNFYNAVGGLVNTINFNVTFTDIEGNKRNPYFFDFTIPFDSSYAFATLVVDGALYDSFSFLTSQPSVTVTNPQLGDVWNGGMHYINWTATNANTFSVAYTPDNGTNWFQISPLLHNVTSYLFDASTLPPSTNAKIRVYAMNSYNTTYGNSANFKVISTKSIIPFIISPFNGSILPFNTTILLQGSANEALGSEIPENQTFWEINGIKYGQGKQMTINLLPGSYNITFVAFNNNQVNYASIEITINGIVSIVSYANESTTTSVSSTRSVVSSILPSSPSFSDVDLFGSMLVLSLVIIRRRRIKN